MKPTDVVGFITYQVFRALPGTGIR
jgi:hypothetical protein